MNYAQAYSRVTKLAAKGDVEGIQELVKQATAAGLPPALVMTLGSFAEAALLNKPQKR